MERPTPTKEEKEKIREWLELTEKHQLRSCPFKGLRMPCGRCDTFFPESPYTEGFPGDTPCPCAALGLDTVTKIAKEELLNE